MLVVDDHLLLRTLVGAAPAELLDTGLVTTTGWWWRLVSPLARPRPVRGKHSGYVADLSHDEAAAVWTALQHVGQPGSAVRMPELVPLGPAMAWLARHEGLNRLAAEVVAVARDLGAAIRVAPGNEGVLAEVAPRFGIDFRVVT